MSFEVLHTLEALNAIERAVFVLRTAFDSPYSELAAICDTTEANCRQILKRTRQKIAIQKGKKTAPDEQMTLLMENLLQAVINEDTSALTSLLKQDIILYSDGGGKATAALHPLMGKEIVAKFLFGLGRKKEDALNTLSFMRMNHQTAVLLSTSNGPESIITFEVQQDRFSKIFIIRNPDKLFFAKSLSQNN